MALIDLTTYKALLGIDPTNTSDDAQITALLDAASRAVETFTGRKFNVASGGATVKSYIYDGSGFLDIDDCTGITQVEVVIPNAQNYTLTSDEYTAMPGGGEVFYYIIMHGGAGVYGVSPEMGFERNLDQYPMVMFKQPTVNVTATWGWSAVPTDVKLATALTIQQFVSGEGGGNAEGLSAEAIEGWSRSWGGRSGTAPMLAIPNRARDLLAFYQRLYV
jgi:hypothetical protein